MDTCSVLSVAVECHLFQTTPGAFQKIFGGSPSAEGTLVVTNKKTYDLQESLRLLSPQRVPKSSSESLGVLKETNRRQRTACGLEGATPLLMRCALVFFLFQNRKEALPWDVGAPATKNFPPSSVGFLQGRRIPYLAPACYQTAG